ncbi:MAG: ATP-binding cassette domain-containing protein [Eubacterium sp.]|nr:ATP-binding cassette domain-containing protein [Eubacterium sp.]MCI6997589.1 ATP-binding cassette domain-containing protein [Eubacterium sp.]
MDIIKVENASKSFNNYKVLDNVSLSCEAGKIYGIVGYNGSGKTVLFKCICGFYHLDEGEIWIRGKKMKKDMDMLTEAGIIIEEPAFLRNHSGYRNLDFLYRLRNHKNKKHIYEIMNKVGLDPSSRKKVCNYSLGMRQRLAIAQAIMEDQPILILDEPMNGLDKRGVIDMRNFFEGLKKEGKTILMASHSKEDIDVLCDEVYEMDMGKLSKVR